MSHKYFPIIADINDLGGLFVQLMKLYTFTFDKDHVREAGVIVHTSDGAYVTSGFEDELSKELDSFLERFDVQVASSFETIRINTRIDYGVVMIALSTDDTTYSITVGLSDEITAAVLAAAGANEPEIVGMDFDDFIDFYGEPDIMFEFSGEDVSDASKPPYGWTFERELPAHVEFDPAVQEDGILISKDVIAKFRVVEGKPVPIPSEIYGDPTKFKPFPPLPDVVAGVSVTGFIDGEPLPAGDLTVKSGDKIIDIQIRNEEAPGESRIGDLSRLPVELVDSMTPMQRASMKHYDPSVHVRDEKHAATVRAILNAPPPQEGSKPEPSPLDVPREGARRLLDHMVGGRKDGDSPNEAVHKQLTSIIGLNPFMDHGPHDRLQMFRGSLPEGMKLTDATGGAGVVCRIAEPGEELPNDGQRADMVMEYPPHHWPREFLIIVLHLDYDDAIKEHGFISSGIVPLEGDVDYFLTLEKKEAGVFTFPEATHIVEQTMKNDPKKILATAKL